MAGSALVQHRDALFPLKIDGAAPILVSRGSAAEFERDGDRVRVRVQKGRVLTPGLTEALPAGRSLSARGNEAEILPTNPPPREWKPAQNGLSVNENAQGGDQAAPAGADTPQTDQPAQEATGEDQSGDMGDVLGF